MKYEFERLTAEEEDVIVGGDVPYSCPQAIGWAVCQIIKVKPESPE